MSVEIRSAEIFDSSEIARLTGDLGYRASSSEIRTRLEKLLGADAYFVGVADEGSSLRGWIAAEHRWILESGEVFEIVGLVVDSQRRRSGTGNRLVSAAEEWARCRGAERMCVRSDILRPESHRFYEKFGYVIRKTQHSYIRAIRL